MAKSEANKPNSLSVEEAKAAIHRLRLAFSSGSDKELRAAHKIVAAPHALDNLSGVDRAVVGALVGEVSKYFFMGGRA
jgi:hypothetical protein